MLKLDTSRNQSGSKITILEFWVNKHFWKIHIWLSNIQDISKSFNMKKNSSQLWNNLFMYQGEATYQKNYLYFLISIDQITQRVFKIWSISKGKQIKVNYLFPTNTSTKRCEYWIQRKYFSGRDVLFSQITIFYETIVPF